MEFPSAIEQFIQQHIERIAAPLCIEYDSLFCLLAFRGPAIRYGLQDMTIGELLPEALDFLQGMTQDEDLSLSYVTLPTGAVAHIHLLTADSRRFIVIFDACEQHRLVQSQQQQANELRLLSSHQQHTLEQLSRAKSDIESQRAELETLSQAQARYIAMMSHEFRTPINAILGYVDLLKNELKEDSTTGTNHISAVKRAAWHLSTMVENVLEQARLGRDQVSLTQEPTSIKELIQLLTDLFQGQAKERGLQLYIRCAEGVPDQLMLDVVRVRQIAINLVGNALRYTLKGQVCVEFSYQQGLLSILVEDTGPGIPSSDHERIFRPYERGQAAAGGGAGLGLSICRQIAELMGGSLRLIESHHQTESKLQQTAQNPISKTTGSRFLFQVPCSIPDNKPASALHGQVLVLDDDPDLRQWLDIVLQDWGLETELLDSLTSAREWFMQIEAGEHSLPDLFITDYLLEDGVGVEAMKQIRAIDPDIPVVMLTGSVPAEEGVRMTHDPNFLLLAKPISAPALRHSLSKMLPTNEFSHQDETQNKLNSVKTINT